LKRKREDFDDSNYLKLFIKWSKYYFLAYYIFYVVLKDAELSSKELIFINIFVPDTKPECCGLKRLARVRLFSKIMAAEAAVRAANYHGGLNKGCFRRRSRRGKRRFSKSS
jgi:hypothetical protein